MHRSAGQFFTKFFTLKLVTYLSVVAHFPGFLFEYAPVKWGGKMKHILIAYFITNIAVRNQNHNIG